MAATVNPASAPTDSEQLAQSLRLLAEVRASATRLFRAASDGVGVRHVIGVTRGASGEGGSEDSAIVAKAAEKHYLHELKGMLDEVDASISALDQSVSSYSSSSAPMPPLGHSVYLCLEPSTGQTTPLYSALVGSHRWLERSREWTSGAASILSQNNLSRSYASKVRGKRRRPANTCHAAQPASLDREIANLARLFPDMTFSVSRPNGSKLNTIVEVTLERILRAVVIFKGLMVEWVVVKGYNEAALKSSDTTGASSCRPEVWAESKWAAFRHVSDNANAAMLNFQAPQYPELAVKHFFTYLHSYVSLFSDRCKRCGFHLKNNLPPTWREFKSLESYHEDCRP